MAVLLMRALLLRVYIRATGCWKLPGGTEVGCNKRPRLLSFISGLIWDCMKGCVYLGGYNFGAVESIPFSVLTDSSSSVKEAKEGVIKRIQVSVCGILALRAVIKQNPAVRDTRQSLVRRQNKL